MKRISILVLSLVLTAALFAGCGCTNTNGNASTPTGMTEPMPTVATAQPTTRPTTAPTVPATRPDTGNGPLEDSTTASDAIGGTGTSEETQDNGATARNRDRSMVPNSGR